MGGCVSRSVGSAAENDAGLFPERGKKLRKDATLREVYRVGGTIGAGGFSKVKIVTDRVTKQQYACKIMSLPPTDSQCKVERMARKDTLREIDAVLDLDHPNIVGMREYFVQSNKVYLIMDLLRGGELLDVVNTMGHYSEADARTIFCQLMGGVQYLHSRGVVHRDLKLDNMLLVKKGDISTVKIADFGIARKESSISGLNMMATVCGTSLEEYIAPEVIAAGSKEAGGRQVYGPACDLWSCGIILFMLLGGAPPFWDESQPKLIRKIAKGDFTFSEKVWTPISREAKDLISRLLVVNPTKRLTCKQVMAHRWMASCREQEQQLLQTLLRMKSGSVHNRRRSEHAPQLHDIIADASRKAEESLPLDTPLGSKCSPSIAPSAAPSVVLSVSE